MYDRVTAKFIFQAFQPPVNNRTAARRYSVNSVTILLLIWLAHFLICQSPKSRESVSRSVRGHSQFYSFPSSSPFLWPEIINAQSHYDCHAASMYNIVMTLVTSPRHELLSSTFHVAVNRHCTLIAVLMQFWQTFYFTSAFYFSIWNIIPCMQLMVAGICRLPTTTRHCWFIQIHERYVHSHPVRAAYNMKMDELILTTDWVAHDTLSTCWKRFDSDIYSAQSTPSGHPDILHNIQPEAEEVRPTWNRQRTGRQTRHQVRLHRIRYMYHLMIGVRPPVLSTKPSKYWSHPLTDCESS